MDDGPIDVQVGMDALDRKLLWILQRNARITYRVLSEKLDISIPSIQKRMVSLEGSGRIRKYSANINLRALGATFVVIRGRTHALFPQDVVDRMGKNESIMTAMCGGNGNLIIGIFLRSLSDLDSIVQYVREEGKVSDPEILFVTSESDITCTRRHSLSQEPSESDITNLDYRIINALHDNARRPIVEVADIVGVSVKTVSRRLSRLMDEGLIDLQVIAYPNLNEDLVSLVEIGMKPGHQRKQVIEKARQLPGDFIDEDICFSNAPNKMFLSLNTQTINELNNMLFQIKKIEGVASVTHDIIVYQQYFDTWRDKVLAQKGKNAS